MLRHTRLVHLFIAVFSVAAGTAHAQDEPDLHAELLEVNRAQLVMFSERSLLPPDEIAVLAATLHRVAEEQTRPGAARSLSYNALEARLTELAGPVASNLHLGRSNNDLGTTINRMRLRELTLELLADLAAVRALVQDLAAKHVDTVMPGFTHAVQAQPTTLAHFLLAFDAALERDGQRLREAYARINLSTLGSGAFTTSGFALDRPRLAELLGFPGLVENSYDAVMVSSADSKVEFASALGISALGIGRFVQYLIFQYDDPAPGILLTGAIVGRSSIMPQKRNPSAMERLRLAASEVAANAQAAAFFVHNTPMYEVKDVREDHFLRTQRFAAQASDMYRRLREVLSSLTIRVEVLRDQVDRDYATMTELADTLHREARVPFRIGYRVASELATYGRERGKRPRELTHAEVADVYRRVTGDELPLDIEQVRRTFDPAALVANRKGRGGPQPAEVRRMHAEQQERRIALEGWIEGERARLRQASEDLSRRFEALAAGGPR